MEPERIVVAGNWKMNHGPAAARSFMRDLILPFEGIGPEVIVFPPALSLAAAVQSGARDTRVSVGVQNIHFEERGAFTGEVSAGMAVEAGATYALIGHSERRHVFGETDEHVARKVTAALLHALAPVVCVGETLQERREGRVEEVILLQLDNAVAGAPYDAVLLLAYEPIWAIGTGETATPIDAAEAHGALRKRLSELRGAARAARVPILYGGSVKPENAADLLAATDVDGVLVGGASLDPASFARIIEAAL